MHEAQVAMHQKFLSGALLECRRESAGFEVVYCLDYDVIFAFLRPDVVGTRCTAAVRYLLENTSNKIAIPPGTFSALLHFIERSNRRYKQYHDFGRRLNTNSSFRAVVDSVLKLQRGPSGKTLPSAHNKLAAQDRQVLDAARPEMIDSVLTSHRQIQLLVEILKRNDRFLGVLMSEEDFEVEPIDSLASRISYLGQFRTMKPMSNQLAAMNIRAICRARAIENESYLRGSIQASCPPIRHLELITNTPSLFRLSLDDHLVRDEFHIQEEPSINLEHSTLMATAWEAMYRAICHRSCTTDVAWARIDGAMALCNDVLQKLRTAHRKDALRKNVLRQQETDFDKIVLALRIEGKFDKAIMDRLLSTYDEYVNDPILQEVDHVLLHDLSVDTMKNKQFRLPRVASELSLDLMQASDKLRQSVVTLKNLLLRAPTLGSTRDHKQFLRSLNTADMKAQKWFRLEIPDDEDSLCFQLMREAQGASAETLLNVDVYNDRYAVHWETTHTIDDINQCFRDLQETCPEVCLLCDIKTRSSKVLLSPELAIVCSSDIQPKEIYSVVKRGSGITVGPGEVGAYRPAIRSVSIPLRGGSVMIEATPKANLPREICVVSNSDVSETIADLYLNTSNAFVTRSTLVHKLKNFFEKRPLE